MEGGESLKGVGKGMNFPPPSFPPPSSSDWEKGGGKGMEINGSSISCRVAGGGIEFSVVFTSLFPTNSLTFLLPGTASSKKFFSLSESACDIA